MSGAPIKSRRGVYYDLTKSPHEYMSPCGDLFKFSSRKKLDIYRRDIVGEIARVEKMLINTHLISYLPADNVTLIIRYTYRAFYARVEGITK